MEQVAKIREDLENLTAQALQAIEDSHDQKALESLRVEYMGKKSQLTTLAQGLGRLSAEERPQWGAAINAAKQQIALAIKDKLQQLQHQELQQKLLQERIDVTLPGRAMTHGSLHPVMQVWERAVSLLELVGFERIDGPEIEDDYHNFSALNMPEDHPARAMQDTFYFPDGTLLRTQTSSSQIRTMKKQPPPIRIISPGRVYRRDSDPTHTPMFHQLEGLVVDEHCCFTELKAILHSFMNRFFEKEVAIRFRPSYFPYTEPSAEVDILWNDVVGDCEDEEPRWLEVLGCGMVHPYVLKNMNIDTDKYTGYAFGVGLDRLAMLRYGVPDLRLFFQNDIRFLSQFIG